MKHFVTLRISGQGLALQEITDRLGVLPSTAYRKGDAFLDAKLGHGATVYQEDCWLYQAEGADGEPLDQVLAGFVETFEGAADDLRALSDSCAVTLWVSSYPEEEQTNFHIDRKTIAFLAGIHATLDLSVSFLGSIYQGGY